MEQIKIILDFNFMRNLFFNKVEIEDVNQEAKKIKMTKLAIDTDKSGGKYGIMLEFKQYSIWH
jgi:hypothetical protein